MSKGVFTGLNDVVIILQVILLLYSYILYDRFYIILLFICIIYICSIYYYLFTLFIIYICSSQYYLQAFLDVIEKQRQFLTETIQLGEDILTKAHQEAVPVMKKWLVVLKQNMDNVDMWSAKFVHNIQVST